ncbi:zinc finger protein 14 [Ixodes scapularis]
MTIRVFVEASPLEVDLEFPNGIEKGGCLTLVLTGPGQKLCGEEKLGIQFSHVNNDIIPVVRTVTVEDDLSACLQTLQKVRIEAIPDETGTMPCVVRLVPKVYQEKQDTEQDLEFPPIGKVLDCLPGSPTMFPAGSPGLSEASSVDDDSLGMEMQGNDSTNSEDLRDVQCLLLDGSEDVDNPQYSPGTSAEPASSLCLCTVCDFVTASPEELRIHIRLHAIQGELCCKVCKEEFHTMAQFKEHCDGHTAPPARQLFSCEHCPKEFRSQGGLERHLEHRCSGRQEQAAGATERGSPMLRCCACSRTFASASALQAHEQSHFEGPPRSEHCCAECGKGFASYRGLRMHQRKHLRASQLEAASQLADVPPELADAPASETTLLLEETVAELGGAAAEATLSSFDCPLCGKQFDREIKRDHHVVRKHTKAYPLQCTMCRRGFMFRKNLDKHFQDSHSCHYLMTTSTDPELSQLKCNYCAFSTSALEQMQQHLGGHPEIRFYACEHCDKEFTSEVRYRRHVESRQCELKPQCDVCGKCLSSRTALRNHRLCHGQDKGFGCQACGQCFKTQTTLKYHLQAKHGELKSFKCEHCSKGFNFLSQKKRHVSRVHLRQTNHSCSLCPMKFMTKRELMLHLLCGHKFQPSLSEKGAALMPDGTRAPNLKLFQCEHCEYASYSRKGYLRHLVDHTGVWPFACDLCGKGFIERNQAERHIRTSHTTESYPCPNCPRVFVLPSSFQEHLQAHEEQRGYACPQCGKYFETQGLFDLHLQAHSRELHYRCQACGQGFSKIASLNFHMIVHKHEKGGPNTWAYACDVCKKRFKYPGSLAAHKYKHAQELVHQCDLCQVTLRTQGLFEAHMRRHRGEKPFKCPYCEKAFTLAMTRRHHVTRFHTGDYRIFCPLCRKGVVSNKMLRRHLYHVHGTVLAKRGKALPQLHSEDVLTEGALGEDGAAALVAAGALPEGALEALTAEDGLPEGTLLLGTVEAVVETADFQ